MDVGIFAKTFERSTVEAVFEAVAAQRIDSVQFNFSVAGLPTLPAKLEPSLVERVRRAAGDRGIAISAVSGTFNLIHPDTQFRRDGLRHLRILAAACNGLGTRVITLCTGTRDAHEMWRSHPANGSVDAWRDLVASMRAVVAIARDNDVIVAFEPETANVVSTTQKARQLLDEISSPELKVVIDPANLVDRNDLPRMHEILDEAFELLGDDIVLAHAKDISADAGTGFAAAGSGVLDYDLYVRLLEASSFDGTIVLHSLGEDQVAGSVAFLRSKLAYSSRVGEA